MRFIKHALVLALMGLLLPIVCHGQNGGILALPNAVPTSSDYTVMIYMIGSDLETRGGLASADIAEMLESAPENVHVLIYADGAARWQTSAIESGTIYAISDGRLCRVGFAGAHNMGDADTLRAFLDFAQREYSADRMALVLWDHGAGPMEGYGRDENNAGDGLTLLEMGEALSNSSFGVDHKLTWIGFDACLMASVEAASTLRDYADYLIASQETEPPFGWDYGFLAELDASADGARAGDLIIDHYVRAYERLYASLPEFMPNYTLSCFNLSIYPAVEAAIDDLFGTASISLIRGRFSRLSRVRLSSKSLGRLSSVSEYDLVDLRDIANRLDEDYPESVAKLSAALDRFVCASRGNVEGAHGVSIYFPCFNKERFISDWWPMYQRLGFCTGYVGFMSRYAAIWLGDSLADWSEPRLAADETTREYVMQLTQAQVDNYASAYYCLLSKSHVAPDAYTLAAMSSDVVLGDDGALRANYGDSTLYYATADGAQATPVFYVERDSDEEYQRFVIPAILDNRRLGDDLFISVDFMVTIRRLDGVTTGIQVIPRDGEFTDGKSQVNLDDWESVTFCMYPRYVTNGKDGGVRPYFEWTKSGQMTGMVFDLRDAGSFLLKPSHMASQDLYCMLIVRDTQGSEHASAMLEVETGEEAAPTLLKPYTAPENTFEMPAMKRSHPQILLDGDGLRLTLTALSTSFDSLDRGPHLNFTVENDTDEELTLVLSDVSINGCSCENMYISSSTLSRDKQSVSACISDPAFVQMSQDATIRSIRFRVKVLSADCVYPTAVSGPIEIKTDWDVSEWLSTSGMRGNDESTSALCDDEWIALRVDPSTVKAGGFPILITNKSERPLSFAIQTANIDGFAVDAKISSDSVSSGSVFVSALEIYQNGHEAIGMRSARELAFDLTVSDAENNQLYFTRSIKIRLNGGEASPFPALDGETIYDRGDVRVILLDAPAGSTAKRIYCENNTDFYVRVTARDISTGDKAPYKSDETFYTRLLPPGIKAIDAVEPEEALSARFFCTRADDSALLGFSRHISLYERVS